MLNISSEQPNKCSVWMLYSSSKRRAQLPACVSSMYPKFARGVRINFLTNIGIRQKE